MNDNSRCGYVLFDRDLLENVIGTLRHVNVRDDDFDSMDRLVGCVGVLTRVYMEQPPVDNLKEKTDYPQCEEPDVKLE